MATSSELDAPDIELSAAEQEEIRHKIYATLLAQADLNHGTAQEASPAAFNLAEMRHGTPLLNPFPSQQLHFWSIPDVFPWKNKCLALHKFHVANLLRIWFEKSYTEMKIIVV